MKEKLLISDVYKKAYRYVRSHFIAFVFLTAFYFIGSLLPLFLGATSFKIVSVFYTYLFFYFAAGCYYRQNILWDKDIFFRAGFRFLTAVVLFLFSIFATSMAINVILLMFEPLGIPQMFAEFSSSYLGSCVKYLFIFILFVYFFIIPSFAFLSEITGKNRSLLMTYAKTKGNILNIALVCLLSLVLLLVSMLVMSACFVFLVALVRAIVLVFITIVYFKMYDFFYVSSKKKLKKEKAVNKDLEKENVD